MIGSEVKENFEQAFLSIPDVDETLLTKDESGKYLDKEVEFYFYWYQKGYESAEIIVLNAMNRAVIYKD